MFCLFSYLPCPYPSVCCKVLRSGDNILHVLSCWRCAEKNEQLLAAGCKVPPSCLLCSGNFLQRFAGRCACMCQLLRIRLTSGLCWAGFFWGEMLLKRQVFQGTLRLCRMLRNIAAVKPWVAVKVLIRCPWQGQLFTHKRSFFTLASNGTTWGPCHRWRLVGSCVAVPSKGAIPWASPALQHRGEAEPALGLPQPRSSTPEKHPSREAERRRGHTWIFPYCAINGVPSRSGMYHQC